MGYIRNACCCFGGRDFPEPIARSGASEKESKAIGIVERASFDFAWGSSNF